MNKTLIATAAAIGMAAIPAAAQAQQREAPDNAPAFYSAAHEDELREEMQPEYRVHFESLDRDRQALYFGWDAALRDYYWSLNDDQREAWWYLNENQRINMFQIQDEQKRMDSWNAIVAKIEAEDLNGQMLASAGTPGMDKDMTFVSSPMVQQVAFSEARSEGDYPICTSDYDDQCMNAWAAGERGPGVDRPLDYWPGESVTETQLGG